LRILRVKYSLKFGFTSTARFLGDYSAHKCWYWTQKAFRPWHSKSHGGKRHFTFADEELAAVEKTLITFLQQQPYAKLQDVTNHFSEVFKRKVSKTVTSRTLKKLNWSWRIPTQQQIEKFTPINKLRYVHHIYSVQFIPWDKLKFCDESSFNITKLEKRRAVLGKKGTRTNIPGKSIHSKSFTLTLLTRISRDSPFWIDINEKNNNQWSFLDFIIGALAARQFEAGDYLIVDNCRLHCALETFELIKQLLEAHRVTLIFLPCYSPELNPCELVFNVIKHHVRTTRNEFPLWMNVLLALSKVKLEHLLSFYQKCIDVKKLANK